MTIKKLYWIVIPLSIVLAGSIVINVMAWRFFKSMETWTAVTEIQNVKFRANKLIRLQGHLNKGEIEEAQVLTESLYGIETSLLELMQDPDLYPKSINRAAKSTLVEIESNFNQSSEDNEKPVEATN